MTKSKKAKSLRPLPKMANRPSSGARPSLKDSPWGEFRISPELAKYEEFSNKR